MCYGSYEVLSAVLLVVCGEGRGAAAVQMVRSAGGAFVVLTVTSNRAECCSEHCSLPPVTLNTFSKK
jgi:hypothetical protein